MRYPRLVSKNQKHSRKLQLLEELFVEESFSRPLMVSYHNGRPSVTIGLIGEILSTDSYEIHEIIDALSTPGLEEVYVVINTQGGDYDTLVMLYSMLMSLRATAVVRTVGISSVMSAGAIIYMAGQERIMSKYTTFMVHTTRLGTGFDSANNIMNFMSKHMSTVKRLITDIFKGYLTDSELIEICEHGKDFYIDETEALKRGIVNHVGYILPDGWLVVEFEDEEDKEDDKHLKE